MTVAIRSPAMIAGSASGSSTRHRICTSGEAHPRRASRTSVGHPPQARQHVAKQDQQRVGDERDLDRRHAEPGERDEQLEERERGDRVEGAGDDQDRRLDPVGAVGDEREQRTRSRSRRRRAIDRELDVLADARGRTRRDQFVAKPVPAERAVLARTQSSPPPKSGMTGSPWREDHASSSAAGLDAAVERSEQPPAPTGGLAEDAIPIVDDERVSAARGEHAPRARRAAVISAGSRSSGGCPSGSR